MKATALLLCGLGLVVAVPNNNNNNNNNNQQADKQFLQKQQDLFQLFVNIQQPNYNRQQQQQAKNFNFQQQKQNSNNPHAVKQFQNAFEQGFLPRGQVFNYNNPNHLQQAIQLFDLFYFAKDYNTFYQAAAWASNNVNEGQFAYAASVAILNRPDTQGIALPPQAEVFPHLYINSQAVQQAQNHKQQGQKQSNVQSNNTNNYAYNQQQQQQQQQQQNDQDYPFDNQGQNQNEQENQANQYQSQNQNNQEGQIAYYNEDINLNQQFAFEQLKNPAWFNNQKYNNKQQNQNQNNGENFYYYLQQALARYNLERYSNGLNNVQPFQFNQNIQPGYNPQLQFANGQAVPARPNNYNVNNANANAYQQFQNIDRRIADVVDSNQAQAADGSKVQLNDKNAVQILGNIVQNNGDSVNNQYYGANNGFYGYLDQCRKVVGSVVNPNNQYGNSPSAIENDNSANRDPAFYQCVSRAVNFFQNFKNQQKPYNQEQLNFQGVQIQSVQTDKLITYFDNAEVDLAINAINYQQGEQAQNYQYKAQQQQLNNKPFNYQINVNSDKQANAIVRVFIGPKYNAQGQQNSLEQARQNFVEIDRFVVELKNGQNQIQRNSQQSTRFAQQQTSTQQLFNQVQQAQQGGQSFYYNPFYSQQQATFPQNLVLPKGSKNGQEYVFAVAVNSYQGNQQQQNPNQDQPQDNRPQGFPFDRQVQENNFQQAQNIHFQTVKVFNQNQNQANNNEQ